MSCYIQTFGSYLISGRQATELNRPEAALLAALVVTNKRHVTRDELINLLWSPGRLTNPSHSLSQALYALRKVLPHNSIQSSRQGLLLDSAAVRSDYQDLQAALDEKADARAVSLYQGRFLADFPYVTDDFDDWRIRYAAAAHRDVLAARWRILSALESEDRFLDAAEVAGAGLIIDELDASLARARITYLALGNDFARASLELDRYRDKHIKETGTIPLELGPCLDATIENVGATPTAPEEYIATMVGRTAEREKILGCWGPSRTRSSVVVVTGEPGIGKTRLVNSVLRRFAISGTRIFLYSASPGGTALPFSAVAGLVRDGFREDDRQRLARSCIRGLSNLLPEMTLPSDALADVTADQPWDAIAKYFERVASSTPLVICIDNLQWADESSRAILTHLSQRLAEHGVLFIYISRARSAELPIFEDKYPTVTAVELAELSKTDVADLINTYCRDHKIAHSSDTIDFLYKKIGGRPFFLLEALRVLREGSCLSADEWYKQLIASPGLSTQVNRRLESSSEEAALLAKAAAVVNRPASLELLALIAGLDPSEAAKGADDLASLGIIKRNKHIEFSHELIREAVQSGTPPYEMALWHARTARCLVTGFGGLSEAAAHFENAGDNQQCYEYARQAAAQASEARAYRLEEEQYLRMLRCAGSSTRKEALYELARFWARTGQYRKLEAHLAELDSYTATTPSIDVQLACAVARMQSEERLNRLTSEALATRARAIINLAARGGASVIAQVVWYVAEHFRRSKQYGLMEEIAAALLREATRIGSTGAVEATAAAALLLASCRGYEHAATPADEAVMKAITLRDDLLISRSCFVRGTVRLWSGSLIAARQDYERAISTAERAGAHQVLNAARANLSVVLAEQAEFEGAIAMAQQSLADGGYRLRAYAYGNLALIFLRSGDYGGVRHYANALGECHGVSPEPWIPPHVAALLGLADIAGGDTRSATLRADFVTENLAVAESVTDVSHLHILRSRAAALRGNLRDAEHILTTAAEALEPYDFVASKRLQVEAAKTRATSHVCMHDWLELIRVDAETKGAFLLAQEARAARDRLS